MRDLIAKIEKLDGPDREVDRIIEHKMIFPDASPHNLVISIRDEWDVPHYTASLDAAVALAERVLGEDEALDLLTEVVSEANEDTVNGTISSLPLALVLATLKAKEAQDG